MAASTWDQKEALFGKRIEPYLGDTLIEGLIAPDILLRQDLMRVTQKRDGSPYAQTYLRSLNNQFDAILNHADNFYRPERSLMKGFRKMGKEKAKEMSFLARAEYLTFAKRSKNDLIAHCAFKILYWCGLYSRETRCFQNKI